MKPFNVFDDRPYDFAALLKEQAHKLVPDYPWSEKDDAFDWLRALTQSLEGTSLACDDLHGMIKKLIQSLSVVIGEEQCKHVVKELMGYEMG